MTKRLWSMLAGAACVAGLSMPAVAAELVPLTTKVPAKSILIDTPSRSLYFVNGDGTAYKYPVAVGRPDKQWSGSASVASKHLRPAWSPPAEIKRDNPALPDVIPSGAPNNPMGEAAIVLDRGEYAIHGTNRPDSIGRAASYGCIRMSNADVLDLFPRVDVGTQVTVITKPEGGAKPAAKPKPSRAANAAPGTSAKPQKSKTPPPPSAVPASITTPKPKPSVGPSEARETPAQRGQQAKKLSGFERIAAGLKVDADPVQ